MAITPPPPPLDGALNMTTRSAMPSPSQEEVGEGGRRRRRSINHNHSHSHSHNNNNTNNCSNNNNNDNNNNSINCNCNNCNSACNICNSNNSNNCTGLGSAESDSDLAVMVREFMESNGSSCGADLHQLFDSSDSDHGAPPTAKIFDSILAFKSSSSALEKDLHQIIVVTMMSIKDVDLVCVDTNAVECRGSCIRRLLVKYLRAGGYDASVCNSKWLSSGKVPGGEYEYVDVVSGGDSETRVIVDIDFEAQFEIARATPSYWSILKCLPAVFVGSLDKLEVVLRAMGEAAKLSLNQNSMPLPPWRTFEYMCAKWMSSYERRISDGGSGDDLLQGDERNTTMGRGLDLQLEESDGIKQCVGQLRHLKARLLIDSDNKLHPARAIADSRAILLKPKQKPLTWAPP